MNNFTGVDGADANSGPAFAWQFYFRRAGHRGGRRWVPKMAGRVGVGLMTQPGRSGDHRRRRARHGVMFGVISPAIRGEGDDATSISASRRRARWKAATYAATSGSRSRSCDGSTTGRPCGRYKIIGRSTKPYALPGLVGGSAFSSTRRLRYSASMIRRDRPLLERYQYDNGGAESQCGWCKDNARGPVGGRSPPVR